MALTASAWMAGQGLIADSNQPDKLDVSDVLAAVLLKDTSTLGQIAMKGTAKGIQHYWFEDSLNLMCFSAEMCDSTSIAIRDAALSTSAEIFRTFRTGALVMPEGTEYVAQIIAISDTLNISTSSYGGEMSAAFESINSTTKFYVVGMPYQDELDASPDISKGRTRRVNYTQIFERGIEIGETRNHIDLYAVSDELKQQIKYRTLEIKRELNAAVLIGHARVSVVPEALAIASNRIAMAGIMQLLRDPDLDATNEDTLVTSAAGGALTMSRINTLCSDIYERGGMDSDSNCCIIVGPYQARIIALLEEGRIRKSSKELVVGSYANKIMTDMGYELDVITDRWCPKDKLFILDRNNVKLMPLQGDAWHLEKMAKTGRTQKYQLSGQYTIELRNPEERHGMLYGLAYS